MRRLLFRCCQSRGQRTTFLVRPILMTTEDSSRRPKMVVPTRQTTDRPTCEPRARTAEDQNSNHKRFGRTVGLVMTITATLTVEACADKSPAEKSERVRRIELVRTYAARHRIAPASRPNSPLKLRPQPLMYWTSPTRFDSIGGIFLWTRDGRPKAYCGAFLRLEKPVNTLHREFHSLTKEPLTTDFDEKRIWGPTSQGVKFRLVPDAKPPAASPVARLRQMKRIASQFSIRILNHDSTRETLRVLPRPIYRYTDSNSGLIDGAIIAFVQGTDPEALLLVEARSSAKARRWHYAIARCTSWSVTARLADDVVYDVPLYNFTERDLSAAFVILKGIPAE